jgi:hypothetical protein
LILIVPNSMHALNFATILEPSRRSEPFEHLGLRVAFGALRPKPRDSVMFGRDKPDLPPLPAHRRAFMTQFAALNVIFAAMLWTPSALADLDEDASRLASDWARRGALAERLAPVFAEHGQSRIIEIAPNPARDSKPGCITVAFLGAPTIDFAVAPLREGVPLEMLPLPDGHPAVSLDSDSVRSNLGTATITRCNDARAEINRLVVSMRSPRGAIDSIVARSTTSLGDARDVLTERVAGSVAPRGNPGRPLEPGPLAERVVRAEDRARGEGAQTFSRVTTSASAEGMGQTRLRLTEGCHRLSVMATVPSTFPHDSTDVDAEARDDDGRVLARDRSETPDARLDFCLGDTTRVTVVFGGAAGIVPVMVSDAVWPISTALPNHWGARVRGGFAYAFRRRNAALPPQGPVAEALGSSGTTMIPVRIEPGHCYFAAVSTLRGEARSIRLAGTIGDRFLRDEVIDRTEGVGFAFCSEAENSARIEVDARGTSAFWVFALFPYGEGTH